MRNRLSAAQLAIAAVLAVAIVVAAIVVAFSTGGSSSSQSSQQSSSAGSATGADSATGFDGAALPGSVIAPDFTLTDEQGKPVSLSDYRGRVTVVSFLYSTCGATCIVIAQQIRGALDELDGEHARPPAVLFVSADPAADTPAHVSSFLEEMSLLGRVQYLTGPLARLKQIWHEYRVTPASAGRREFDEYASVLLVDGRGVERVLFEQEQLTPESLAHDIRKLDGDPTRP